MSAGPSTRPGTWTPSSSRTPRSTPRASTARSARRCSRRSSATARPTSRTPPTRPRRCASSSSTSPRAPTSSWSSRPVLTSTSSRRPPPCHRCPWRHTKSRASTPRSRRRPRKAGSTVSGCSWSPCCTSGGPVPRSSSATTRSRPLHASDAPEAFVRTATRSRTRGPGASREVRGKEGSGLLGELHVERQLDLLGDEDATGLEGGVPGQAPVGAVDLAVGLEGGLLVAPRVGGDTVELDLEGDRLGDPLDGEVTGQRAAVEGGAAERHLRVVLDVEEVRAAEVAVTVGGAAGDGRGRNGDVGDGVGEVLGDDDGAGDVRERAADLGDHEVASDETDLGVRGVDGPGAGGEAAEGGGVNGHVCSLWWWVLARAS